ncbi:hypothetical protein LXL04_020111 [Taraxacum kok-saghyz]
MVRELCHLLKHFFEVTLRVYGTLYVTSNIVVEDIFSIRSLLDDAISDVDLCDISMAMKVKSDKYFGDVEKMNLLFYFSLILDPRNKVKYLVILLDDRYGSHSQGSQGGMWWWIIHPPSSTSSTTEFTTSSLVLGKRQNPEAMPPKPPSRNKLR